MATNVQSTVAFARARTNRYYRAALETLPTYTETAQLRAQLLQAQTELPGVPAPTPPATADDIESWLHATVETAQAEQARTLKYIALAGQINQADGIIEALIIDGTDEILSCLHSDITAVMDKAGVVVSKLRGADTAAAAINKGVAVEWRRLQPLCNAYDQVRAAQAWALGPEDTSRYPDGPVTDLTVSNRDEIIPNVIPTVSFGGAPQPDSFWPDDEVERLIWLVVSGARVWVPTISELRSLARARATRLNEPADQPDNLVNAGRSPARIR